MPRVENGRYGNSDNAPIILCVGPIGSPPTGQALATRSWTRHSAMRVITVDNNLEGRCRKDRLLISLTLPLRVRRCSRPVLPAAMYLSLKRSALGMLCDLAAVLAYQSIVRGPVIVHLHGSDLASALRSPAIKFLARCLWRAVTDVIVLSPSMIEQVRALPSRRLHVIGNFAEDFATAAAVTAKTETLGRKPLQVLYLSNVMFSKGFSYLIEAVNVLQIEGHKVELTIAGMPLGDSWMSSIDAYTCLQDGLGPRIHYAGSVAGPKKRALLAAAHVIALPTFYPAEAQPISLIEGMAFGAVPLTTRHNYNEDFLDPQTAVFVEVQDSTAIAASLRAMIANPEHTAKQMQMCFSQALKRHQMSGYVRAIDSVVADAVSLRPQDGADGRTE